MRFDWNIFLFCKKSNIAFDTDRCSGAIFISRECRENDTFNQAAGQILNSNHA